MSVGSDPHALRHSAPELAKRELLARVYPLMAYLHHDSAGTPVTLRPSPVYHPGAEASAKGAMAYRMGMTMAEWSSSRLIGLPPTLHFEQARPTAAGPDWLDGNKSRPDLWTQDSGRSPQIWVLEAKGARVLKGPALDKGATQLATLTPQVLNASHARVLVGTNVEPLVFVVIRHDYVGGRGASASVPAVTPTVGPQSRDVVVDEVLLAISQLTTYSFLVGQLERTTVLVDGRTGRTPVEGENDPRTAELRKAAKDVTDADNPDGELGETQLRHQESGRGPSATRMIVAEVPGTGIRLGLSHELFGLCEAIVAHMRAVALELVEQPRFRAYRWVIADSRTGASLDRWPVRSPRFREMLAQIDDRLFASESARAEILRRADEKPSSRTLADAPVETATTHLELYSRDTYLSVPSQLLST